MNFKDFRKGYGPYLMAAITILALFLTLLQVLNNAVQHGATVRAIYAERAQAQWRCNSAQGPRERDDCINQLVHTFSRDGSQLLTASLRTQ